MRGFLKLVLMVVGVAVAACVLAFVAQNQDPVRVRLLWVVTEPVSIAVVAFVAFVAGAVVPLLLVASQAWGRRRAEARHRREVGALRREIDSFRNQAVTAPRIARPVVAPGGTADDAP
jgi:uncharacterized integral membrane protein